MPLQRFLTGVSKAPLRCLFLGACSFGLASIVVGPTTSTPANAQNLFNSIFAPAQAAPRYRPRRRVYRRSYRKPVKKLATPPAWFKNVDSKDPVHLVVSLPKQEITVYRGDKALVTSNISTGKKGYDTPAGVFSILERKVRHFSNIYRGAPMPFMQRLTWSGIALHASNSVPNHPASHGCVRLPNAFAPQLFQVTEKGGHVVIANEEGVAPVAIEHGNLFQPKVVNPKDFDTIEQERIAQLGEEKKKSRRSKPDRPIRILVTRRAGPNEFKEMQHMLNELSFGAGDVDGFMGPDTAQAIRRFQATYGLPTTGTKSPELMSKLYEVSGRGEPLNGHLYVRQNFKPVFDMPVQIKGNDDYSLGSHVMTAMHFDPGDSKTRWLSITLTKGSYDRKAKRRKEIRERREELKKRKQDIVLTEAPREPSSANEALSRIVIPEEARARISAMLTPGSSFAISNDGISRETTAKGTDFVLLMQ